MRVCSVYRKQRLIRRTIDKPINMKTLPAGTDLQLIFTTHLPSPRNLKVKRPANRFKN